MFSQNLWRRHPSWSFKTFISSNSISFLLKSPDISEIWEAISRWAVIIGLIKVDCCKPLSSHFPSLWPFCIHTLHALPTPYHKIVQPFLTLICMIFLNGQMCHAIPQGPSIQLNLLEISLLISFVILYHLSPFVSWVPGIFLVLNELN